MTNFKFKTRLLSKLFFSNTTKTDFFDMSNFNYSNLVLKSIFFITKNDIKQTIKRCKSNNASKLDDIFNRIFKTLINKLMLHLINLFRVCAALNYHSRCFRETHIIILKKLDKKNYTNIKTYKSIALLNILDKTFESIIARRINDLTKAHDFFSSIKWKNARIAIAKQSWNCLQSKFTSFETWAKTK
jgi:hypothetical protein